jgi:hypothetical protein
LVNPGKNCGERNWQAGRLPYSILACSYIYLESCAMEIDSLPWLGLLVLAKSRQQGRLVRSIASAFCRSSGFWSASISAECNSDKSDYQTGAA